jgi:hypothetical protein
MKYYIAENGQQAGPFEPRELLSHGLTVNSLVWCEGMPAWTSASQVPELMALLTGQPVDMGNAGGVPLPPVPPMGGQTPLPPLPTPQAPLPQMPTPSEPSAPTTNQPINLPQPGPTTTNTPQQMMPKTWLTESILVILFFCLCCRISFICLIPGIIAVYMAIGVRSKYNSGDIDGANKKSASAKKWLLITVAVAVMASLYDGFRIISSNSNFFQEIQNGNFGFLYWIK